MSVSMLTVLGNRVRSLGAPQGNIWLDVRRSIVGGTLSSEISIFLIHLTTLFARVARYKKIKKAKFGHKQFQKRPNPKK